MFKGLLYGTLLNQKGTLLKAKGTLLNQKGTLLKAKGTLLKAKGTKFLWIQVLISVIYSLLFLVRVKWDIFTGQKKIHLKIL
jgi:hypothetical protein